jgi:hypothetical protein
MNALVPAFTDRFDVLGTGQNTMFNIGFLWAGDDVAQSVGAASKVDAVANDKRGQL